jgi:hypothetical protein
MKQGLAKHELTKVWLCILLMAASAVEATPTKTGGRTGPRVTRTATPSATPTLTSIPATPTWTPTPVPPTPTATSITATATPTQISVLPTSTPTLISTPTSRSGSISARGVYGKDSSASGFDEIVAAGFNLIDRGPYREYLDALPSGAKAFVWLGDYDNTTCTWEKSDDWIRTHVAAIAGHPAIGAYFLVDEPHVWDCPDAPAQLKARSDLVKSLDSGPPTLAVIEPHSPGNPYTPYVGTVDVIGIDRYPCSYANGCVMSKIDDAIQLIEASGAPRWWGVIQAFADSYYRMPTADELHEEFQHWRASSMEGYLVFAWAYGADTLQNHPDLVEALASENSR